MNDLPSFAMSVAAAIDDEYRREVIEGANALAFLQAIYRSASVPLSVRIRAAIEALPFESPKLSATAILQGDGFADRLERVILGSGIVPRAIEHQPVAPDQERG